jgi:Resolvase, N terminal domain
MIIRPSNQTAKEVVGTSVVSKASSFPLSRSHTRSVLSADAESAQRPSGVMAIPLRKPLWPSRVQLDALKKTGCERIFTDKLSGAQVERPGLNEALSQLRQADTLVVWKLDRLGRSVKGLVDLVTRTQPA